MASLQRAGAQGIFTGDARGLDSTLEDVRRIVFESRRNPPPGLARICLSTREIWETVNEQAATQAGLTLSTAREFAARHGMTFHVDLTPAGALSFSFLAGDDTIACASTIRGAFMELVSYLERESGRRAFSGGTVGSVPPRFGTR